LRVAFVLAGGIGEKREKNIHQVEANALAEQVACASRRNARIAREKGVVGEKTGKQTHQVEASALAGRVACGWLYASGRYPRIVREREKLLGKNVGKKHSPG
jgi:hypothetical protein